MYDGSEKSLSPYKTGLAGCGRPSQGIYMSRRFVGFLVIFTLISIAAAFGQPVIRTNFPPVLNAASYRLPGLSGAGIAQGSIFALFGSGLGPANGVKPQQFPLLTTLGGSTVAITVNGTTTDAYLVYVSDGQINAIMPSNTPVGSGTIAVTYNNKTSATAPIEVVASAFGIFTALSTGSGQADATALSSNQNTIIHTFHPGDTATLWGTGLGAAPDFDAQPPKAKTPVGSVTVYVGASPVPADQVKYHGRSGCCSGLDQINFQIPASIQGCYVPVAVDAGSGVGNVGTIAVSASGSACNDSIMGQDLVNKLASGQQVTFGYIRLNSLIAPAGLYQGWEEDDGYASFSVYPPRYAVGAEYGVSAGYCTASAIGYTDISDMSLGWYGAGMDAGNISISGPHTASLNDSGYGFYYASLYNAGGPGRFVWGGQRYTATSSGSTAIGAFTTPIMTTNAPSMKISNIMPGQTVPRSGDLLIQWTGGDASKQEGNVTLGGYSFGTDSSQFMAFQCIAPLSANQFTVPGWIVAMMPVTTSSAGNGPQAFLWIGQRNDPVQFTATGLDLGIMAGGMFNGTGVLFQ